MKRIDGGMSAGYDYHVTYYDRFSRPVQTHSTNHLGGYDSDYFLYDFTDAVLKHRHLHSSKFQAYSSFCRLIFWVRCSIAQIAGWLYSEYSKSLYTFAMQSEA